MFCTKCGVKLDEGARFCQDCGELVEAAAQGAAFQAPPQQGYAPPYQAYQSARRPVDSGLMALRVLSIIAPVALIGSGVVIATLETFRPLWLVGCCALAQVITALVQGKKYRKQSIVVMAIIGIVLGGLAGIAGIFIWPAETPQPIPPPAPESMAMRIAAVLIVYGRCYRKYAEPTR